MNPFNPIPNAKRMGRASVKANKKQNKEWFNALQKSLAESIVVASKEGSFSTKRDLSEGDIWNSLTKDFNDPIDLIKSIGISFKVKGYKVKVDPENKYIELSWDF